MANITITSTTNTIYVDFGDYYPSTTQYQKAMYRKDHIESIKLDSVVEINLDSESTWLVSYDGSAGFQVDSVDGVAPVSDADLYTKLAVLI